MRRISLLSCLFLVSGAIAGCGSSIEPPPAMTDDVKAAYEQEENEVYMQEFMQQKNVEAESRRG